MKNCYFYATPATTPKNKKNPKVTTDDKVTFHNTSIPYALHVAHNDASAQSPG